jgi:hypothetical protein
MNAKNRAIAIAEVKMQRKAFRNENNISQKQAKEFKIKIEEYEANTAKGLY